MNINGIETRYQNYAAAGTSGTKSSGSENVSDSFQKELANWGIRTKQAIDKEKENDSNGNLLMSEKKWRNLMKKVDHALDASKEKIKEQEQEKNSIKKETITVDPKVVPTVGYTAILSASGKKE